MSEKLPYKLTIKLTSSRADAIAEALAELRRQMSDHAAHGETVATVTIESGSEAPLISLCDLFEVWLYSYKIQIDTEVKLARPGVRPETMARLRARKATPMDALEGFAETYGATIEGTIGGQSVRVGFDEDEAPISSDRTPGETVLDWLAARETRCPSHAESAAATRRGIGSTPAWVRCPPCPRRRAHPSRGWSGPGTAAS